MLNEVFIMNQKSRHIEFKQTEELIQQNLLVKHYAGSIAYGTNLPTSDVDFRGIFCAEPVNIRTPFFTVREVTDVKEEDTKFYELSHFMKLCLDCNPNVVETLWVDDWDITVRTFAYDHLRNHRHELLSSKIAFTTSGYALAQLKRIKGHNKWINNPQSEQPPRQIDFVSLVQNFTDEKMLKLDIERFCEDHRLIPYGGDIYGVIDAVGYRTYDKTFRLNTNYDDVVAVGLKRIPKFIIKFNKDEYKQAKEFHSNYWNWKNNRNESRSELEEKFGYDTKHAMHLVRLLRMGVEALRDGELIVKRPDAEELLSIRDGAWTYEEVVKYAESMDKEVREVWYKRTDLPKRPDLKFAARLLMETQDIVWGQNA